MLTQVGVTGSVSPGGSFGNAVLLRTIFVCFE